MGVWGAESMKLLRGYGLGCLAVGAVAPVPEAVLVGAVTVLASFVVERIVWR